MSENNLPILMKLVQTKFGFLFDEYDFELIKATEFRRSISYYIVAESNVCRILFVYEADWDILLGEPGKQYDGSMSGWIPINNVFRCFLGKLPAGPFWKFKKGSGDDPYHAQRLEVLSSELKKIFMQILDTFNSSEVVAKLQVS